MKVENNGKTLSGTTEEMKQEFYRQVKNDEYQSGYWQWQYYSDLFKEFESLTNKHPVFDENTKYRCEMTEKHPNYEKLRRVSAVAGKSKFVMFNQGKHCWHAMLVSVQGKYYMINPTTMNYITTESYTGGQEIGNAYECTQEEIQKIKDSLFSS